MASILEFRKPTFHRALGSPASASGPADVVLFPGVRYERMADEAPPAAPAKSRQRRSRVRDRIDLD